MPAAVVEAGRVLRRRRVLCLRSRIRSRRRASSRVTPTLRSSSLAPILEESTYEILSDRNGTRSASRCRRFPLESYSRALEAAGLAIEVLREPPLPGAGIHRRARIPLFLLWRAMRSEPWVARRPSAGTLLFLVVAPGVIAGLIPWALTGWESGESADRSAPPGRRCGPRRPASPFWSRRSRASRSKVAGRPHPSHRRSASSWAGLPLRPQPHVPRGRRDDRRAGPAPRAILLRYAIVFLLAVAPSCAWYEEPTLARRYGAQYEAYRRAVPGWLPRRTPWEGGG